LKGESEPHGPTPGLRAFHLRWYQKWILKRGVHHSATKEKNWERFRKDENSYFETTDYAECTDGDQRATNKGYERKEGLPLFS
jgi:hypothetical protein